MTSEAILSKLKKLKELGTNNANEHERNQAMERFMELCIQHNIHESQVDQHFFQKPATESHHQTPSQFELHQRIILEACNVMFYTTYYVRSKYTCSGIPNGFDPVIVGTEDNIETTKVMFDYLRKSIEREGRKHYTTYRLQSSFWQGAARKVLDRASQMVSRAEALPQPTNGTSLMVLRNALERANDQYIESLGLSPMRGSRFNNPDGYAFNQGQQFGAQINLSKQISSNRRIEKKS